uniref:Uncharacterized protein n=1 Tax=Spermophilus dauricus TaxID=99837 RepID=A0A8C9QF44_SPEDA
ISSHPLPPRRCRVEGQGRKRNPATFESLPKSTQNRIKPSTYVPAGSSAKESSARLCQARSQVSSAARKSRCTTRRSAASSSRCTEGVAAGTKRAGSLLRKGAPSPLRGAAEVEMSLFIASLGSKPVSSNIRRTASPETSRYPGSAWERRGKSSFPSPLPVRRSILEKEEEGARQNLHVRFAELLHLWNTWPY